MNNNLEFENEDPSPDSIEDNHPRTNYGEGYYEEPKQEEDEIYDISDHDGIGNAVDNLNNTPPQETLEDVTEQLQNECHKFVENVSYVTYQDATNTFIFMKLAELTLKLKNYEKRNT
jgi:hypothetical protein